MTMTTLTTKKLTDEMNISDLILHNDHQVVALNKPPGIPAQNDKTGDTSLHTMAQAYSKRDLFVVHRIDRPCSGVVIYAKSREAAANISAQFTENQLTKTYLAVVPKGIEPRDGVLEHKIEKTGSGKVVAHKAGGKGKAALLRYRWLEDIDNYSLLEVRPESGRLHQIRAQLGAIGFPVKGDVKYGARRGNRDRSVHLHAFEVVFRHPTKGNVVKLVASTPDDPVWNAFGWTSDESLEK